MALIVFAAVLTVAFGLLVWWGRDAWFTFDEWDLLALRRAGSPYDLFLPHYDHWSTLPILVYRLFWTIFGVRTYVPYQLVVITAHLSVAALLRAVMRRSGCNAWFATVLAGAFAFIGLSDTILNAWFMTFIGALAFGIAHLVLADHDGAFDRRDAWGLVAGLAGLLCAGIGAIMVVVVGIAALVRRGWRIALLHTAPLGVVYLVWLATIGTKGKRFAPLDPTFSQQVRFVAVGVRAGFQILGRAPGTGLLLAAVIAVGTVLARRSLGPAFRRRAAAPLAMLAGVPILLAIISTSRAGPFPGGLPGGGPEYAREGRYVYLVAALLLPAIGFAAEAIYERWRVVGIVAVALVLVGLPANVRDLRARSEYADLAWYRQRTLLPPALPRAAEFPKSLEPEPLIAPDVTLGWLLAGVRSGRVPAPEPTSPTNIASTTLRLALERTTTRERPTDCEALSGPVRRVLPRDETMTVASGAVDVVSVESPNRRSFPLHYSTEAPDVLTLRALIGPLALEITPASSDTVLCGLARG